MRPAPGPGPSRRGPTSDPAIRARVNIIPVDGPDAGPGGAEARPGRTRGRELESDPDTHGR